MIQCVICNTSKMRLSSCQDIKVAFGKWFSSTFSRAFEYYQYILPLQAVVKSHKIIKNDKYQENFPTCVMIQKAGSEIICCIYILDLSNQYFNDSSNLTEQSSWKCCKWSNSSLFQKNLFGLQNCIFSLMYPLNNKECP